MPPPGLLFAKLGEIFSEKKGKYLIARPTPRGVTERELPDATGYAREQELGKPNFHLARILAFWPEVLFLKWLKNDRNTGLPII